MHVRIKSVAHGFLSLGIVSLFIFGLFVTLSMASQPPSDPISSNQDGGYDLFNPESLYRIELQDLQRNAAGISSRYVITNLETEIASTSHTFYKESGAAFAGPNYIIPGSGSQTTDLADISGIPDDFRGYVIVSANKRITGTVLPSYFPDAITDLTASNVQNSLHLTWTVVTHDTSGYPIGDVTYTVYRTTNPPFLPPGVPYASTITEPFFTDPDSTVIGDTSDSYYYVITAMFDDNESDSSNLVGAFAFPLVLNTP